MRRPKNVAGGACLPCWKNDRRRSGGEGPFSCDFVYSKCASAVGIRLLAGCSRLIAESEPFAMIAIGSDHGGVELKDFLVATLRSRGVEVEDLGTNGNDSVDYPDYGRLVALKVAKGEAERGILLCTNGIGMSILANKFPGVRAALVYDLNAARMSREHNNSNILVLGGGVVERSLAEQILEVWLQTPFAGGRHQRRLDKIAAVEKELGTHVDDEGEK